MNSSLAIANYFIHTAVQHGLANKDFPASKVHGLVYLAHGWLLGSAGAAVIQGQVMADRDGIFIPDLKEAGCWGTKNVTALVSVVQMDAKRGIMVEQTPQLAPNNPTAQALSWVWKTYGPMSSFSVGQHIKEAGSPWDKIWNDPARHGDAPRAVPNTAIRAWFRGLSSRRVEQSHTGKLSKTQQLELKPKVDKSQLWVSKMSLKPKTK
jgi:uncharacterized phage-associated protein